MIEKVLKRFPKKYRDDLSQELYIKSVELTEKGVSHAGYFYRALVNHAIDYLKQEQRYCLTLDNFHEVEEGDYERYTDTIEDEVDYCSEWEREIDGADKIEEMEKVERFIKEKYADGMRVEEIQRVYEPFHHIKSEKTLRKILK